MYFVGLSGDTYEDIGGGLPYTTLSYANGKAFYVHNIPDTERHITR